MYLRSGELKYIYSNAMVVEQNSTAYPLQSFATNALVYMILWYTEELLLLLKRSLLKKGIVYP